MAANVTSALMGYAPGGIMDQSRRLPNSGVKSEAIHQLVNDLQNDRVHALIFCGVNPEYSASREFRKAMLKAPFRAAINLYEDETAAICDVSIPGSHWLESWSDAVTFDGTLSVQQPMIRPLNDGVESTNDTLLRIARGVMPGFMAETETFHDVVKGAWATAMATSPGTDTDKWNTALKDGVFKTVPVPTVAEPNLAAAARLPGSMIKPGASQVLVIPSLTLGDGTYSNNAWLLELPDPVTKVTWDNVALMSAGTAVKLGVAKATDPKSVKKANGTVVTMQTAQGSIDAPVWVQPGMADDVVALSLGFGRTAAGRDANGVGVNAYAIASPHHSIGYVEASRIAPAGTSMRIACSQDHHSLDDGNGTRPVAKWLSLHALASGELELGAEFPNTGKDGKYLKPLSIVPDFEYKGHRWGMVIDMSACTGCSSCIIACQSENNISVVGKEQVLIGREMHWIRLDRYYVGDMDSPETVVEPMLCQHCENAPCENVCPVAATTHSPEGLNEMTYNRCVGTRYCLNNCPYKVRRFNFLDYNDKLEKPTDLVFNPDITMRMRGVMEKCTFCVRRLHEAKWHARDEGRARVMDGEAITACQEACPAGAIIFGDTNDPNSAVSIARQGERGFRVLEELNVRPQVTYLAKVRNA
jgi:molybdopterin-containing oxidoreductase family iron-sulfur binding subunit